MARLFGRGGAHSPRGRELFPAAGRWEDLLPDKSDLREATGAASRGEQLWGRPAPTGVRSTGWPVSGLDLPLFSPSPAPATGPARSGSLLGDLLVEQGLVTPGQLAQALAEQPGSGLRVGELLIQVGALDERQLTRVVAEQFGIALVDLRDTAPDPHLAGRIGEKAARELTALPLRDVDGVVDVVVGDPRPGLETLVSEAVGAPVQLFAVTPTEARHAIDRAYRALADVDRLVKAYAAGDGTSLAGEAPATERARDADSPVAKLLTVLMTQALRDRASDVHVEPGSEDMRVRFRIDGALHDVLTLPPSMSEALVSRVKFLAGLDVADRRRPQDGRFGAEFDGRPVEVRVSTMATVLGETCALRVVAGDRALLRLDQLGMAADTCAAFESMVRSTSGMVLCAGPPASGRTATLYAVLSHIEERSRSFVTVEDPVEHLLPSITQVQANGASGVPVAEQLRTALRQDPDVVVVGEIRDADTARTAVQAAVAGRFVLASLRAADSAAALRRVVDMGADAFLVASSLVGVLSQRLVRRTCRACAAPYQPTESELAFYADAGGPPKDVFRRGEGCTFCAGTGYQDRIGVYELLPVTPEIRRLVVGWASEEELRDAAISRGMRPLRSEGVSLVARDLTTVSEVMRSIHAL